MPADARFFAWHRQSIAQFLLSHARISSFLRDYSTAPPPPQKSGTLPGVRRTIYYPQVRPVPLDANRHCGNLINRADDGREKLSLHFAPFKLNREQERALQAVAGMPWLGEARTAAPGVCWGSLCLFSCPRAWLARPAYPGLGGPFPGRRWQNVGVGSV